MIYTDFYNTSGHSYEEYEKSHGARLDFLVEDLKLNELTDQKIFDVGCGIGHLYNRLSPDIQKNYYGYDGFKIKNPVFKYSQLDLDTFGTYNYDSEGSFDISLCFETLEHLSSPYNCLVGIKKLLKIDGKLLLSIPHVNTKHNTLYPGLFYPTENFIVFLGQMAFEIKDLRYHDKCFSQNVFTLINKNWSHSRMLWYNHEDKFRNVSPQQYINF